MINTCFICYFGGLYVIKMKNVESIKLICCIFHICFLESAKYPLLCLEKLELAYELPRIYNSLIMLNTLDANVGMSFLSW